VTLTTSTRGTVYHHKTNTSVPNPFTEFDDSLFVLGLPVVVSICPLCCLRCQCQCNQLPGKTRLQNDLLCVLWDVKPYTLSSSLWPLIHDCQQNPRLVVHIAITIWHSLSSVINHTLVVDPALTMLPSAIPDAILRGCKILKWITWPGPRPFQGLTLDIACKHTKFDNSSFSHSRDISGLWNSRMHHMALATPT